MIEIADRFWPYHKQLCETPVSDQTRYTERVRRLFLSRACVQGTFGAADEKLAVELYRRHVPLEQIERAYLLGCVRKYVALLNRPGAALKKLEWEIADILFRPPGRPSAKPLVRYKSFRYQSESWSKARRIVAKVEHRQGELFPRGGFIVTSMSLPSRSVVRFYNKRGTAEQWIKEGKQATHWTRLSCHRFRANEVRLQLSVLAYNLGNLWRRLGLPNRIKSWSLTSLQHRWMKTGGRLVKHARYYWLLPAEGHLNRRLFGDMLHRIWALPLPSG